jgi:hypothetical protein
MRMRALGILLVGGATLAPAARADSPGECHFVDIDFVPSPDLQIVAWIEDGSGNYIDTAYITQSVGTYGLGNRPGRFDFNSGPHWPYGRRITTFPVWSHAHGMQFPEVLFQDGEDSDLSHEFSQSSTEPHFCRPMSTSDATWDAGTCATPNPFTDKGVLSSTVTVGYPPRADIKRNPQTDTTDVSSYASMDPFDAVSQATPAGDTATTFVWSVPATVADGNYTLFVETGQEFDQNNTYNEVSYPAPMLQSFGSYGQPYRGQPSIVYEVPISIGSADATATTTSYAGYGDPNGSDGNIRPPDATISTTTVHSGALRLELTTAGTLMYRVRAQSHVEFDVMPPAAATNLATVTAGINPVVSFTAPGDDGGSGQISGYDIRVSAIVPITTANFSTLQQVPTPANLVAPGQIQDVQLDSLLPDTDYYIGIEALDNCHNVGPLATLAFHTSEASGEVDACFVATAAYGSVMAADVQMLRRFRDAVLRHSVLGELFTESYYTFGPPVAHVVGESELLRETARDALSPLVDRVKSFAF